jgi:hypothetical protein
VGKLRRPPRRRPRGSVFVALVGDALLEPFWPEGLGINRGFMSALDACWGATQHAAAVAAAAEAAERLDDDGGASTRPVPLGQGVSGGGGDGSDGEAEDEATRMLLEPMLEQVLLNQRAAFSILKSLSAMTRESVLKPAIDQYTTDPSTRYRAFSAPLPVGCGSAAVATAIIPVASSARRAVSVSSS